MSDYYFATIKSTGRIDHLIEFHGDPPVAGAVPDGAITLTSAQHADWLANVHTRAWVNGALTTVVTDEVWEVPSFVVVNRISAAGKLRAALTALMTDVPLTDSNLTDAALALRTRWQKSTTLFNNDADVINLLQALGLDPSEILAK